MTVTPPGSPPPAPVRWRLFKGLVILLLTGGLVTLLVRWVFWQEETALEAPPAPRDRIDREPTLEFRSTERLPSPETSRPPIRIGRSAQTPQFSSPPGDTADSPDPTVPAETAAEPAAALRLSRGFQQPVAPSTAPAAPAARPSEAAPPSQPRTISPDLIALLTPAPPLPTAAPAAPSIPAPTAPPAIATIPDLDAVPRPPRRPPAARPPAGPAPRPSPDPSASPPQPVPDAPDTAPALPTPAPDPAPPQTAAIPEQVQVQEFVVTGSTVFEPEDLAAIALTAVRPPTEATEAVPICEIQGPITLDAPLSLTPSELVQASEAIEQCYIQAGYINSGAFIAEAELADTADTALEISVVEGQLETINVEVIRSGLFGLNPSYVESRLNTFVGNPFNLDELVEAVQLLELDPLINQISTEIVPGTQTGTSILNARVVQDDGLDATLFFDNDRSPSVGSLRRGLTVSQANLLGIGDRLSLGYNLSEGSSELSLGYTVPINPRNGVIGVRFATTQNEVVEEPFTILDIQSASRSYEVFYRQPLILTPSEEFALSLTASHRDSQAEFLEGIAGEPIPFPGVGADAEGRTRITALRFGQEWISRTPEQVVALLSEFSMGINALGATIQPLPPDNQFFLWRGQGQWVRRLAPDTLFILRGNMQLANRPLLPNEQFSFGGQSAGRGYRLNTLLRDNGWFVSSEVRIPLFRIPEDNILMQIAPFFEVGGGWNQGDVPNTLFLTSTGLGLLLDVDNTISARLDWGIPLSDFETTGTDLQDSGIYFSIQITP